MNLVKNGGYLDDKIFKKSDNSLYRTYFYYLSYFDACKDVRVNGIPLEMDEYLKKFEPWEFKLSSNNL